MTTEHDECLHCQHSFAEHAMLNFTGNAMDGGIMLCPEPKCQCYTTWSTAGAPSKTPVNMPTHSEIDSMRRELQGLSPQEG